MLDARLPGLDPVLPEIRRRADMLDVSGDWPTEDLRELDSAGFLARALPESFGGTAAPALDQHMGYEAIARASLAVALIVSQRDAAIGLIDASQSLARDAFLKRVASGEFTTVGIAQLTTSRQGGKPALLAVPDGGGYRIDGSIPWCTGAARAGFIVVGAVTEDSRHLLFALPSESPGLEVDPPLTLVALRSTWTTALHCQGVHVPLSDVLAGPAQKVLSRNNHLALGQAFLAMGLCRSGIDLIAEHRSDAAASAAASFDAQLQALREQVLSLCQTGREPEAADAAAAIRARCNDLAVRITHAAVALYKGSALLAGHPAQRLAREAMFLLVWSCPNPVIDCTVEMLARC